MGVREKDSEKLTSAPAKVERHLKRRLGSTEHTVSQNDIAIRLRSQTLRLTSNAIGVAAVLFSRGHRRHGARPRLGLEASGRRASPAGESLLISSRCCCRCCCSDALEARVAGSRQETEYLAMRQCVCVCVCVCVSVCMMRLFVFTVSLRELTESVTHGRPVRSGGTGSGRNMPPD